MPTMQVLACRSAEQSLHPLERRPSGTPPEPGLRLWCLAEVQAGEDTPAQHRGDVQIRHRESVSEEVRLPGERTVEHRERRLEAFGGVVGLLGVALVLREKAAVEQGGEQRLLELGHGPPAP